MIKEKKGQIVAFCDEVWASDPNRIYLSAALVEKKFLSEVKNYVLNARYYPIKYCEERQQILEDSEAWKDAKENLDDKIFSKHNREVSYSKLTASGDRFEIAKRWMKVLNEIGQRDAESQLKVKVLSLDKSNLDLSEFGDERKARDQRIYRRFFRSNLTGGKKIFWSERSQIVQIWHDRGPQQEHGLNPKKITESEVDESLKFVNSNHKEVDGVNKKFASNMVQLADLMAGSLRILHRDEVTQLSEEKCAIARETRKIAGSWDFHTHSTFPKKSYKVHKSFLNREGEQKILPQKNFEEKELLEIPDQKNDTLASYF